MKTLYNKADTEIDDPTIAERIKEQLGDPVFYIKTAVGATVGLVVLSVLSNFFDAKK